jgi:5-keto 4-deoxyuronate isomerase
MDKDTLTGVIDSLIKEPMTYVNVGVGAISFMSIEEKIKIAFYVVSIAASILVSYKYWLEIKNLKKQNELDGKSTEQENISNL